MAGKNPPIDVEFVDPNRRVVPDWYDRLKYLDKLQPLSEIPAPVLPTPVTPGTTSASVTSIAKTQSTSPVGSVQTFLIYSASSPTFNQELANDMTTIADALSKASTNDANLATAVSTLSTRLNTLETKFNALLTALA